EHLHAEAGEVVVRPAGGHHLDGAAGQPEGGRPAAAGATPLHELLERAGEEVVLEALEPGREQAGLSEPSGGGAVGGRHQAASSRPSTPTRRTVELGVRAADTASPRSRRAWRTGAQSSPPLAASYTNARKNTTLKKRMAQNPAAPSASWATA